MKLVSCENTCCIYCDTSDNHCTKDIITVGEDYDNGCGDYEPYYNSAEYGHRYYICVKTIKKELAKAVRYGKRIEYKGRVFYTSDRVTERGEYQLTDEETGYGVGMYATLEDRFEKLCDMTKNLQNVQTLPDAEWDYGGYVLTEEKK